MTPANSLLVADVLKATRNSIERNDAEFHVGREKTIVRASSFVLSMWSEYFDAMFYGPMKKPGPKDLTNIDPATFHRILDFCYVGSLNFESIEDAFNLKEKANYLVMKHLERECDEFLWSRLKPGNVVEFLSLWTDYASFVERLRRKILQVATQDPGKVFMDPSFSSLPKKDVIDLSKLYAPKELKFETIAKWGQDNG